MRPKLKPDVLYVPTADGVHLFGAGANLELRGGAIYQWVDRLAPHLNGTVTLDNLLRGLPDDKRAVVAALLERLEDGGCLTDAEADEPHGLTDRELATYAPEIAFVEYYRGSAARRFETYRNSSVVVLGAGPAFTALIASALHSGVRRLRAVCTPEFPTDEDRLTELTGGSERRDPDQELIRTVLSGDSDAELAAALEGADAVLHVSSAPVTDRAVRLHRLCERADRLLVQGIVLDDVAWLGPSGAAWASAWQRLAAPEPSRPSAFLTGPTAAVVAGHLGLACFTALTGARDDGPPTVTRIDLETLRTSTHPFLPHPSAVDAPQESAEEFGQRVERLRSAEPLLPADFSARAAACFDRYTGVLRALEEGDFTQLPLNVTEAVRPEGTGERVFGWGTGFAEARQRAALRGLARYAVTAPDPRRFADDGSVRGWDLARKEVTTVPAGDVFTSGPGVTAALDWTGAVTEAVAQQCAWLAVEDVRAGAAEPVLLDVAGASLDEAGRRHLDMLRPAGGEVTAADIGTALGVPVLAWWQGARPVGVTCGPGAVTDGLELVLLDRQSELTGESAYAPQPVPGLGAPPRGTDGAAVPADADLPALVEALASRGRSPVVVPLDHDPAVHEVLPNVVRVVLAG
uniref:Thiazole synthase n=1 Tax=Streptomyces sp. NRRL WC-3908 TaxID=1509516 RepID=A0A096XPN9_9ACTN|nr:thiazole synthase [Streptomyces sp. NRRL WC-3908]